MFNESVNKELISSEISNKLSNIIVNNLNYRKIQDVEEAK